jgi:hypothetical protein
MKDLDAFLPNIRPYAPGVAEPAAFFAIRQAAIAFCERTRLWRYEDEFTVAEDGCEAIVVPYGAVIHEIERADFNGKRLTPMTPGALDDLLPDWRSGLTGTPRYVTQTEPDTIALVPKTAGTVTLHLYLKPAQDADELPDFIVDQHRNVIAHGALMHILTIPNQSFTNPDMAAAYAASFERKLDSLFNANSRGQQRAPNRTKANFF